MSTDIKMTKKRALSIANLSNELVSELKQYADKTEGDLPEWLQAKIEQAYQLILSAYGTLQAEELEKALGHKYKKRVPYTNSKGKKAWKYFYDVANSLKGKTAFDDAHLVEGAKFQVVSAKGKEVHAHVTKVVGDKVTYVLDDGADKGKVITKTKSAILKDMDKEHKIVDTLKQKVKEKRADVKQAKQTGTAKQIQRLQEQADRLQTAINKFRGANNLAREELLKDIVEGKAPSRLPKATQEEFSKLEDMFNKLEKMENTKTPTGRIKNFKKVKELREQIVEQVNLLGRPPHSNDYIDTALGARSANSASLGNILLRTVPSTKQSLIDFNHVERRAFFKEVKKIYERHTKPSEENNFETMPEVEGYTPTSQEQFKQDRRDLEDKKGTLNSFKLEYEGDFNRFGDKDRLTEEQYNQLKSELEKEITDLEIKTNEAGFNLPGSVKELEDRMKSAFPQIKNIGQYKDNPMLHIDFNSEEDAKEFMKIIRSYREAGSINHNNKRLYDLSPDMLIEVLRGYENKVKFEDKEQENNFETMPEVEPVDNFETMPEVEAQPSSFLSDEELDKKSIEEISALVLQESNNIGLISELIYKEHAERALNFPESKELNKIKAELREIFQRMEEAEENNDELEMLTLESEEDEKQEEARVLKDKIRKRKDDLYKELVKKYKRDEVDAYYNKLGDLLSKKIKEKNEVGEAEREAKKKAEREAKKNLEREAERQKNQDENVTRLVYGGRSFLEYTKEGFTVLKNQIKSELEEDKRSLKNLEERAELYSPNIPYELGNLIRRIKNSIHLNTRNMARLENFEKKHNFETMPDVEKPFEEKFKVGRKSLSVYDILKNKSLKRTDKSSFDVMNHLELMSEKVVKASIELLKELNITGDGLQHIKSALNISSTSTSRINSEILSKILQNVEYKENTTIAELAQKIAELVTNKEASKKEKELEEETDRALRSAKSQAEFEPQRKELVIDRAKLLVKNDIIRRNLEKGRNLDISKEEIEQLVLQRDQFLSKKLNRILKNIEKSKDNKINAVRALRKEEEKARKAIDRYYKKQEFSAIDINQQDVSMNIKGEIKPQKRWVVGLPKKRSDIVVTVNDNESYLNVTCTVEGSPFNGFKLFDMPVVTNLLSTPEGQEILKDIANLPRIPKTQEQLSKVQEKLQAKIEKIKDKGKGLRDHPIHESTSIITSIRLLNDKIAEDIDKQIKEQTDLRKLDTSEGARQELISRGEEVIAFSDSPDLANDEIIPLSNQLVYYLQNFNAVYAKHKREKDTSFGDLTVLRKVVALLRTASESLTPNTRKKSDLDTTIKIFIDDIKKNKNLDYYAFQAFRERVESAKRILGVASIPADQQDDSENFETMPEEVEQENNFETMPEVEQENNFETMPEVEAQPSQELTNREKRKKKVLEDIRDTYRNYLDSTFDKSKEFAGYKTSTLGEIKKYSSPREIVTNLVANRGGFKDAIRGKEEGRFYGIYRADENTTRGFANFLIHNLDIKNIKDARANEDKIKEYVTKQMESVIPGNIQRFRQQATDRINTEGKENLEAFEFGVKEIKERLESALKGDDAVRGVLEKEPSIKADLENLIKELEEKKELYRKELEQLKKEQEAYTDADYVKALLDNNNTRGYFSFIPKGRAYEKQVGTYVNEATKEILDKYINQEQENNFETMPEVEAQPTQELPENKTKAHQFASLRKKDLQERLGKLSVAELIRMAKDNNQNKIDFKEKVELTPRVKRLQKELEEAKRQFQRAKDNNFGANDEKAMVQRKTDQLINARERAYKSAGDFAGLGVAINKELAKRAGGDKDKLLQYMEEIAGVNNAVEAQPTQDQAVEPGALSPEALALEEELKELRNSRFKNSARLLQSKTTEELEAIKVILADVEKKADELTKEERAELSKIEKKRDEVSDKRYKAIKEKEKTRSNTQKYKRLNSQAISLNSEYLDLENKRKRIAKEIEAKRQSVIPDSFRRLDYTLKRELADRKRQTERTETKTNLYVGRERLDRLLSETETSGENPRTNPGSALPSIYDVKEAVSTVEGRGKALENWYNGRLYNEVLKIIDRGDSSGLKDLIEEFKNANELLAKQGIASLDRDMIPVLRDAGTPTGSKSKEAKAEYNKFKTEYLGKISKLVDETNVPSDVQIIEYFRDKTLARLQGSSKQQAQDFLNAQIEKRKADSKPARKTAREELEESALTTPEGLTEEQAKKYRDQAILNEAQIKEAGSKLEIEENKKIYEPKGKLKNVDSLSKKQKALFDKTLDKPSRFVDKHPVYAKTHTTDTGLMYSTDGKMIVMTNLEEFEPSKDNRFQESFLKESVSYPKEDREQLASFSAKTVRSLNKKIKAIVKGTKARKAYNIVEFLPNESTGTLEIFVGSTKGEAEPVSIASVDTGDAVLYNQTINLKYFRRLLDLGEDITLSQKDKFKGGSPDATPLHFGTDSLEGAIMTFKRDDR